MDPTDPVAVLKSNFCFPLENELSNDLVHLVPFVSSKHAEMYFEEVRSHPEAFKWVPYGPFNSVVEIEKWEETWVDSDPNLFLFAVKDKTRAGPDDIPGEATADTFAGVVTLMNGSPAHASVEIGHILILPKCQRTHVLTNVVGILLQYCLDSPKDGGLGLRRVQWQTNAANEASVGAARRLGFRFEGILRWQRVLPEGKVGPGTRDDGRPAGRDTAMLAICFDDWEGGEREAMTRRMVLRK